MGMGMRSGLGERGRCDWEMERGRYRGRYTSIPQGLKRFHGARSPSPGNESVQLYQWVSPPSPKAAGKEQGDVKTGLTATWPDTPTSPTALIFIHNQCLITQETMSFYELHDENSHVPMEICEERGHYDGHIQLSRQSLPGSPSSKLPCKRASVSAERFPLSKRICLFSP